MLAILMHLLEEVEHVLDALSRLAGVGEEGLLVLVADQFAVEIDATLRGRCR
jgi:hypothetical protein